MEANRSEVARIRQMIELESQAAFNGLHGLRLGTAKHQFINARLERISELQEELTVLIGPEQAIQAVIEVFAS